jgi:anti-sigma B factor antagonist
MSTIAASIPEPRLTMKVYTTEGATVVECSGRLSIETGVLLKDKAKGLISRAKSVVLDLSSLTYMDSSGLGVVVGLYVSARIAGCEIRVVNLNRQVREMLRITNLLTLFEGCGQHLMKIP